MTAVDSAGSNDGTYVNYPELLKAGFEPGSTAVHFSRAKRQHVAIDHVPAYTVPEGSVSLWYRTKGDLSGVQGLFSKDDPGQSQGGHLAIFVQVS